MNRQLYYDYFNWLCDQVYLTEKNRYSKLAFKLHVTTYIYDNDMDYNRAEDGIELRDEFLQKMKMSRMQIPGEANVLEVLIALSRRIDDICWDSTINSNIYQWFFKLLNNLKLDDFNDIQYERLGGDRKVEDILNNWMRHNYKKNGENGGLFPMRHPLGDMRNMELAMQMHHYLAENDYHL